MYMEFLLYAVAVLAFIKAIGSTMYMVSLHTHFQIGAGTNYGNTPLHAGILDIPGMIDLLTDAKYNI